MKLFNIIAATVVATVTKSRLAGIDMNPDDETYSPKVEALFKMLNIDIENDPYFSNEKESNLTRNQDGTIDARALKQLKLLVSSQISEELKNYAGTTGAGFGLYCYYGCHCLTDIDHINPDYGLVGGPPIDDIDITCKQMGVCYKCLREKYMNKKTGETECVPERTRYRFSFNDDNSINCSKNKDPCAMDTCLCDKDFAETVAKYESQWQPENHIVRGGFDRKQVCKTSSQSRKNNKFETCCNMNNFPYVGYMKTGHDSCCGSKNEYSYGYDSKTQTCCEDNTIVNGNQIC